MLRFPSIWTSLATAALLLATSAPAEARCKRTAFPRGFTGCGSVNYAPVACPPLPNAGVNCPAGVCRPMTLGVVPHNPPAPSWATYSPATPAVPVAPAVRCVECEASRGR